MFICVPDLSCIDPGYNPPYIFNDTLPLFYLLYMITVDQLI